MFDVPPAMQRLVDQVDGWLDLRCPERALELIDPLLGQSDSLAAGLSLRIRANARLGNHDAALADLGQLRALHPEDDWIDLTEGWCRRRTNDLPGAIRCVEQLVQRNTRSDTGYFNLACYHALSGHVEEAIDNLSIACGLNPKCRDIAREEPDFDGLRKDDRFRQLLRPTMG